jgi:alpha-tubulin suppressor-like RCC1 family protein
MEVGTVAAGLDRSFFVDANGALLACGREEGGEVGLLGLQGGTSQTSFMAVVPTPVPFMAGVRIRTVACAKQFNLAVSEAGQVFEWGRQLAESIYDDIAWSKWQPPVPTIMEDLRNHRVCQVASSQYHCAALTKDGALFTWETLRSVLLVTNGHVPELGYGSLIHDVGVPHRVLAFEGLRIASVAVGVGFTVTVTEAGAVYSFGMGDGRLGHGEGDENVFMFLPKRIEALDGVHVATVAAGGFHALALTRCGRVHSWGADGTTNPVHGLGNATATGGDRDQSDYYVPQLIPALLGKHVWAIVAGPKMSCAVTDAGALYT